MPPPNGWKAAIVAELRDTPEGALHYTEIAERIAEKYIGHVGANPNASVAVTLGTSINSDAETPFIRVGWGRYALRSAATGAAPAIDDQPTTNDQLSAGGALQALGMYWQRSLVHWQPTMPNLFGRQSSGASQVNFANQIGVYLLHDRDRVIYVGRAADALTSRLRAHTSDRLSGRWDRFSWFGLKSVDENGALSDDALPWSQDGVIATLEALLIESLEPPLNRKRGDSFSAIEYLQGDDPELKRLRDEQLIQDFARHVRNTT